MATDETTGLARELKRLFDSIEPYIQGHTKKVCAVCKNVCCIDRHGRYDRDDEIFISSLGFSAPPAASDREETDPCRYHTLRGCSIERWLRPFRCTWYFCDTLLESMGEDRGRAYREFVHSLQRLIAVRRQLLD